MNTQDNSLRSGLTEGQTRGNGSETTSTGQDSSLASAPLSRNGTKERMRELLEAASNDGDQSREEPETEGGASEPEDQTATGRDEAPEGSSEGDQQADGGAESKPRTLAEIAELAGLTETELYDTMRINIGDGEAVTLAGAKEKLQGLADAQRGIAEREEQANQLQARFATDIQAAALLDMQNAIPQDVRERTSQALMQISQREVDNFRQLLPEYADETAFQSFIAEADKVLATRGLTGSHFGVRTADMYAFLSDVLRWKRNSDAYTAPKPKKPPTPTKKAAPKSEPQPEINVTGRGRAAFAELARAAHRRR